MARTALARKGEEIGLAHIEVEMDRIERDERREQCGRTAPSTAAGDQVADGDEMRADAAICQWRSCLP